MKTIPMNTVFTAAKDQVSCQLGAEVAILHLKSGMYYGLNPVAAAVWSIVQQPHSLAQILASLQEQYEVGLARCEEDVCQLLRDMQAAGLVEAREGNGVSA